MQHRTTLRTSVLLLTLIPSGLAQIPTWRLTDQTSRNEITHLLTTISTNTYPAADGTLKHATLQLKCSGTLTSSATISVDPTDTFDVTSDAITILSIRLDNQRAIPVRWANLSLHQILLYDLRDLLPPHHRMSIDLPLASSPTPQTLTFDLSGLAATMQANNCRRRLH